MSVEVRFIGRLGNNLFQYAVARIIAEHHGFKLICKRMRRTTASCMGVPLNIGPAASLEGYSWYFPNAPFVIPGKEVVEPVDSYEVGKGRAWRGHTIDLQSILKNPAPRRIVLSGYFQRFEYIKPYEDRIRDWFRLRPISTPYSIGKKDLLINIRRGLDFGANSWSMPLSFYRTVLSRVRDVGKVYVCGTGIDANVRRFLGKYKPIYYDADPIHHFAFIQRFNRIILSNSTFAWWAAFLSRATRIYAPRLASNDIVAYSFRGYGDVDLRIPSRRYREVEHRNAAAFGLFSQHETVNSLQVSQTGNVLIVERRCGKREAIEFDHGERNLLKWIVLQDRPLVPSAIRQQAPDFDPAVTVLRLVQQRILSVRPGYLDDGA